MRGKGFKLRGFTLIELLVTISILSILMTIALLSFQNVQKNARDGKRKSDISTIQSALEQYHADQGFYPITGNVPFTSIWTVGTKTYMTKVPQDLQAAYNYAAKPLNCTATTCTNYCLYAPLENSSNAVAATPNCTGAASMYETQAP